MKNFIYLLLICSFSISNLFASDEISKKAMLKMLSKIKGQCELEIYFEHNPNKLARGEYHPHIYFPKKELIIKSLKPDDDDLLVTEENVFAGGSLNLNLAFNDFDYDKIFKNLDEAEKHFTSEQWRDFVSKLENMEFNVFLNWFISLTEKELKFNNNSVMGFIRNPNNLKEPATEIFQDDHLFTTTRVESLSAGRAHKGTLVGDLEYSSSFMIPQFPPHILGHAKFACTF